MGLLDSIDDPRTMGLLSMGLRLMSTPGKFGQAFGQAGIGALGDLQQARQQQEAMKARKTAQEQAAQAHQLQQQLGQQQLLQAQQQAQERQRQQAFLSQLQNPAQAALNGGGGPTQANAAKIDPLQELMFNGVKQGVIPLQTYLASLQKDETPIALGEGGKLVTRGGREIASNPKAPDLNSLVVMGPDGKPMLNQLAIDAKTRIARAGASSTSVSYGAPVAGVDASGRPVFFQPSKDGSAPAIVSGVAPPKNEKPMTEAQAKAATFMSQMQTAEKELSGIPIDMSKIPRQIDVGLAGGWTNIAASPAAQRARQAQEQWAESFLRFKTGAAATADEVKLNVRTFFPQPGDSREVIEQKQRMRKQAILDIGVAASGNPPDHSAGKPKADGATSIDDLVNKWTR